MRQRYAKRDNRGFSLIELMVVIAIMAVMLGVTAFSLAFLFGTEAKQAAQKISAQLSETKTGAMSRYDESVTFSYRQKDETAAITSDGYYAEHKTWTIANTAAIKKEDTDTTIRKVASGRVSIMIYKTDGTSFELGKIHSVTISFNRTSGAMEDAVIDGDTLNPVSLDKMVMKSGNKEYTITFIPETGKHILE